MFWPNDERPIPGDHSGIALLRVARITLEG